ncbi:MAG: branched-chain amino acid ABC transporter permease [Thermodesulfobacteriota bacterium]
MAGLEALRLRKGRKWIYWGVAMTWLAAPLLFRHWEYGVHIAISMALYVVLTLSLNLVNGLAGQLNLGHAAFFGIGAYTAALLMLLEHWSFWSTLPMAFLMAALFGALVGLPSLRVGGDYLGIVTLGLGEITRLVLINWIELTRGPMGLPGIPAPRLLGYEFGGKLPYFYLITLMAMFTWLVMRRLAVSKMGLVMLALREDERVANTLGVNTGPVKVLAFAVSAGFAGLAGAFFASYVSFISPDTFMFSDSAIMLCMVVLGGIGSLPGVVIGAVVLTVAPEALRFIGNFRVILYGVVLSAMMIYRPAGIWGLDKRVRNEIKESGLYG